MTWLCVDAWCAVPECTVPTEADLCEAHAQVWQGNLTVAL
jgi:hypothetical protein